MCKWSPNQFNNVKQQGSEVMSGSGFKVPYTTIKEIKEHPNAHSLEIAVVYGFEVIIAKGCFSVGDGVIYIPIESVIPQDLEDELFPEGSKITLSKHRVRQIRIRKYPSQGMLISVGIIEKVYGFHPNKLEADYSSKMNVIKYEAPVNSQSTSQGKKKAKKLEHPLFNKYGGITNIKWCPDRFKEGVQIVISEKLHGSHGRIGVLPFAANTIWKKFKKLIGVAPEWEKVYGSNNVQLQDKKNHTGYYGEDLYGKTFNEMDAYSRIKEGEVFHGEIIGAGIQKGYDYGLKDSHKFVVFDIRRLDSDGEMKWLDPHSVEKICKERGFEHVPVLYKGGFDLDLIKSLTLGNSVYCPSQKVREGIVIRPTYGVDTGMGSKNLLKMISEKYLDKEQSENR